MAQKKTVVYIGKSAQRIIQASIPFTGQPDIKLQGKTFLADRQAFNIGDFQVTPFLVDHSAYDAYALLIEAGGCKLFDSSDFRGHGRKAALFEKFIQSLPQPVHALLMEGTSLGRAGFEQIVYSAEQPLKVWLTEFYESIKCRAGDNLSLVLIRVNS